MTTLTITVTNSEVAFSAISNIVVVLSQSVIRALLGLAYVLSTTQGNLIDHTHLTADVLVFVIHNAGRSSSETRVGHPAEPGKL